MEKLDILYEDKELLIVNKKAKLLTIATPKEKEKNLYNYVSTYVKKQYPKNKIYIINRLDKDTSGIVVFAKNIKTKKLYQNNWSKIEGKVPKNKETLKNYLQEDKNLKVYVSKQGKLAITNYEVLSKTKNYTLLKINILTGRKNQIRAQLSNIKHPIIGDKKYNANKNPINRLGLHVSLLILKIKNKEILIKAKIPTEFKLIFKEAINKYEKELEWKDYKK